MRRLRTAEDVYAALEELVVGLDASGRGALAKKINHRLHKVAWTTRLELLEEMEVVIDKALKSDRLNLPPSFSSQMGEVLRAIRRLV